MFHLEVTYPKRYTEWSNLWWRPTIFATPIDVDFKTTIRCGSVNSKWQQYDFFFKKETITSFEFNVVAMNEKLYRCQLERLPADLRKKKVNKRKAELETCHWWQQSSFFLQDTTPSKTVDIFTFFFLICHPCELYTETTIRYRNSLCLLCFNARKHGNIFSIRRVGVANTSSGNRSNRQTVDCHHN